MKKNNKKTAATVEAAAVNPAPATPANDPEAAKIREVIEKYEAAKAAKHIPADPKKEAATVRATAAPALDAIEAAKKSPAAAHIDPATAAAEAAKVAAIPTATAEAAAAKVEAAGKIADYVTPPKSPDPAATEARREAAADLAEKTPATPEARPDYLSTAAYDLLVSLDKSIAAVNAATTTEGIKAMRKALRAVNGQLIKDHAKDFAAIIEKEGLTAFYAAYFTDWTVMQYTLTEAEAGFYRSDKPARAVNLPFAAVDTATAAKTFVSPKWRAKMAVIAYHALIAMCVDPADPDAPRPVLLQGLKKDYAPAYPKIDPEGTIYGTADAPKVSMTALQAQLSDLCRDLFPADFTMKDGKPFTVRAADRRAWFDSLKSWKRKAGNDPLTFRATSAAGIEEAFFSMCGTRYRGEAYIIDGGAKADAKPTPVNVREAKIRAAEAEEAKKSAPTPAPDATAAAEAPAA